MEAEYTLEPPHSSALLSIIASNLASHGLPEKLTNDIHLISHPDQISNFKHDESSYYPNT